MHLAELVDLAAIRLTVGGRSANAESIFPAWTERDRLGIITHQPFGALRATLPLQVAAELFYRARPERRTSAEQYPQVYVFHVGRPRGDMSGLDVWPRRHDVVVDSDNPGDLLGAMNDRAITRVLVPDASLGSLNYIDAAPSGWTDTSVAHELVRTVLAYPSDGREFEPEIEMSTRHADMRSLSVRTLQAEETFAAFDSQSDEDVRRTAPGPSTVADIRRWSEVFRSRNSEVPRDVREQLVERHSGDELVQQFRESSVQEMLSLLPSIVSGAHA